METPEEPKLKKESPSLSSSQISELIESLNNEMKLASTASDQNRFQKEIEYLTALPNYDPSVGLSEYYKVDESEEGRRR